MFILDSGCGWIPDPPIKFMYHIINLIKNLTPVILIIMGSLDFGKAVMSQKEDEIKKAQGAFIKKLIAGAAVFFVVVFAKWMVKIIDNAGGNTGNAFNCVSLLLTGSYSADDTTYYDGPNIKTTKSTTVFNWKTTTKAPTQSCYEENKDKIEQCIKENTGNTAEQFYSYKTYYDNCISDFQLNGNFYEACIVYEDCMHSQGYNRNALCEEINYSSQYSACQSQYNNYQSYVNKYGQYTETYDTYNQQCNQYAQAQVDANNNGNNTSNDDNIKAYCQKLYCNN